MQNYLKKLLILMLFGVLFVPMIWISFAAAHNTEKVFLSCGSFRVSLDDKSKSVGLAQRETKVEMYDDFVVRFYDDFGEFYHIDRLKGYLAFSQKNAPQRIYECEIGRKF